MCVRILIDIVIIKYSSLIQINTNTKHIHKTNTNNHAQYLHPIIDHKVYSPSYKYKYRSKQCVSEYSQIQLSSNTLLSYISTQTLNTYTKQIQTIITQYLQTIIDHKVYSPSYKYKYRSKQCVSEYSQIQLSSNTLLSYISTQTLNTYTKQIQTIMHNTYILSLTTKCIVHHTNTNIEANNVCQNTHRYSYHQILFSHTNQHKTKHIHKTNTNNHAQYLQTIIDHKVYSPSYKYKYRSKQCVSEYSQIQLSSNTLLSYKSTQTLNTYTKQIQTIMHNTYILSLTTKCTVHTYKYKYRSKQCVSEYSQIQLSSNTLLSSLQNKYKQHAHIIDHKVYSPAYKYKY